MHAEFGETDDSVSKECIANRTEQINYLGNMKVLLYVSDAKFDQKNYEDNAIVRRSRFVYR